MIKSKHFNKHKNKTKKLPEFVTSKAVLQWEMVLQEKLDLFE